MNHIKDIASGDFFSLKALYKEHHIKVYRLALCILDDPFLAREATQETFLRVQRNADCYSPVLSEITFLAGIARSLCLDILKKRALQIPEYEQTKKLRTASMTTGSHNDFMNFLAPLSDLEQEILCLRFLCELNDKEIGIILSKTPRMIKRLYNQALRKLNLTYRGEGGDSDSVVE